jgi:hypothetical protein
MLNAQHILSRLHRLIRSHLLLLLLLPSLSRRHLTVIIVIVIDIVQTARGSNVHMLEVLLVIFISIRIWRFHTDGSQRSSSSSSSRCIISCAFFLFFFRWWLQLFF